ncbi:hypothetical protein L5515_015732 [Caenorhabditis briggsae]|uniref:Uncharacterized protein n=1 Tax=Caenorhabditis briggsae TaxID=6238 RepID=A0AAE9EFX5_CAEBR|nr:hypothetical protein L5515_015732 [Caenorhabditis briggsae]
MANHYSLISLLLGQFFNTAVQFQIEKEQFNFTIQTIHSKRRFCSTQEESDGLEDVINHIDWICSALLFPVHSPFIHDGYMFW